MSLKLHQFFREFDKLPKDQRFALIEFPPEPTSFFVIFQKLSQLKVQRKRLDDMEEHLLRQAEDAFNKIK